MSIAFNMSDGSKFAARHGTHSTTSAGTHHGEHTSRPDTTRVVGSTISAKAPDPVLTTGVPLAMASTAVSPNGSSHRLGTSAAQHRCRIVVSSSIETAPR